MTQIVKVLREDTENYKLFEELNKFLVDNGIELQQTVYNGIVISKDGKTYKYGSEGQYTECLPPSVEGKYILCDEFGNTDFYNE